MGAQMVRAVEELIFTSADDSIIITLCDGRVIEFHGDGYLQEQVMAGSGVEIVDSQI